MTLHLRQRGPLGIPSGYGPGRYPGPLGVGPGVYLSPNGPGGSASRLLPMPAPADDSKTKVANNMKWELFPGKLGLGDIEQQNLLNCPVGALLGALAHTESGRKQIRGMIEERAAAVETDVSKLPHDIEIGGSEEIKEDDKRKKKSPGRPKSLASSRFFVVKLGSKSVEVSPVLYTDESREPNPIYMTSRNNALWPCMIEKAYAQLLGSYGALNSPSKTTANKIWEDITGVAPDAFEVKASTSDQRILEAARRAKSVPTIAASSEGTTIESNLQSYHGFVVLGTKKGKKQELIEVYDAAALETTALTLADFRKNFTHVLFARS